MSGPTLTCPHCGVTLKLGKPLAAGASVKCPKCGARFTTPAEQVEVVAVSAVEDGDSEPTQRSRGRKRSSKRQKESSKALTIAGFVAGGVLLVAMVVGFIFFILKSGGAQDGGAKDYPRPATAEEDAAIRTMYTSYQTAIRSKKYEAIPPLLDAESINWFAETLALAKKVGREELIPLDAHRKLLILQLRQAFPRAELAKLGDRDVASHYFTRLKLAMGADDLARVIIVAPVMAQGLPVTSPDRVMLVFWREDGQWKISLAKIMRTLRQGGEDFFRQEVERNQSSVEEEMVKMIETETRKKVDRSILEGPLD